MSERNVGRGWIEFDCFFTVRSGDVKAWIGIIFVPYEFTDFSDVEESIFAVHTRTAM